MAFEKKVPEWLAKGVEPPESLKTSGFEPGYKPPADYFNWFWHTVSEALTELQEEGFAHHGDDPINKDGDTVDAWAALGSGYARYTDAGTLTDKPSRYGILLSVCGNGKDIFQLWYATTTGPMFHRSGNANGWNGTWKKVYDTAHKPTIDEIMTTQLSVALGGTGATTKKDAFRNLAFIGQNPIASVEDDTIENWAAIGSGFAWFSELDRLNNQPSNYGLLINYVPNNYEVTQIWKIHSSGAMFIRSGNGNGWGQQWTKIYDAANKPTPAEIGATPIENAEKATYDMDAIIASGDHAGLYITNANTLGTPYKKGVSTYTEALILSYGSSTSYAMQIAFVSGGQPLVRYLHNGALSDWFSVLTSAQPVTIKQGGTGANSAAGALENFGAFRYLGKQIISSTANDTIAKWSAIDSGYSYYETAGLLNGQPTQYGMLIHFHQSTEVFQIWRSQSGGPTYWRSGNSQGWASTWAKVYDAANKPTPADIGAATSGHGHALTDSTITGTLPVSKGGTGATTVAAARTALDTVCKSGDTMSGSLNITKSGTAETAFVATNANGSVALSASGSRGLYDNGNKKWVVQSAAGSTDWTFHGKAAGLTSTLGVSGGGSGATTASAALTAFGIRRGTTTNINVAASGVSTLAVTFSSACSTAPIVTLTVKGEHTNVDFGRIQYEVTNVTTTGFTIRVINKSDSTYNVVFNYIAVIP